MDTPSSVTVSIKVVDAKTYGDRIYFSKTTHQALGDDEDYDVAHCIVDAIQRHHPGCARGVFIELLNYPDIRSLARKELEGLDT